jgi:glucose-1-phosphate adenylyltransferase
MRNYHGIIFAYQTTPELRELVSARSAASLPFCGRYRLIDFPLSSMRNAGILDCGVIMQRNYQSLLDHIGSGKAWDMSRRSGGLRMLPPFGLPEYHTGNYIGTIEALNAVSTYVRDIPQKHVVLMLGSMVANIDLDAAIRQHESTDSDITAIVGDAKPMGTHHRFIVGPDGYVRGIDLYRRNDGAGMPGLEGYIIHKEVLLDLMDRCKAMNLYAFHKDALTLFLSGGGKMDVYIHRGYATAIRTVEEYYKANRDMLDPELRRQVFPAERPVRTKIQEYVSTYYGEEAVVRRSLVADNCVIEGEIENCIVFSGARIARGAHLKDCIVMRGCTVEKGADLRYVIADKVTSFSEGTVLAGNEKLPLVVPKGTSI